MLLVILFILNGCANTPVPTNKTKVYTPMKVDAHYDDKPEVYPVNSWSNNDALTGNTYNRSNDILYNAKVEDSKIIRDPSEQWMNYTKENR